MTTHNIYQYEWHFNIKGYAFAIDAFWKVSANWTTIQEPICTNDKNRQA